MSQRSNPPAVPAQSGTLSNGGLTGPVLDRLEGVLAMMVDLHQKMLEHNAQHREALRRADAALIARCVNQQCADVAKFNELETLRNDLFSVLARAGVPRPPTPGKLAPLPLPPAHIFPPSPPSPLTLSGVIERAGEQHRARLTALGNSLRALALQVEKQRAVLKIATESLLSHMQGMLSQVSRSLSPTGTYARPRTIPSGLQVMSSVDLVS